MSNNKCKSLLIPDVNKLFINRLHIDTLPHSNKCLNKSPKHIDALRWIGSGGSIAIFGECSNCYKYKKKN